MKTNIEKIQDRLEAIETNVLTGSNLTDTQRNFQLCIQVLCDEIKVILTAMEKAPVLKDEVDDRKFLIKDNPNLIVTSDNTPEVSIHNVEGVFLESPHVNQDRVFGPTIWRGMNVLQSVKKDGETEIRRVKVTLFSDDKNKIKMERGHIGTAIRRMSKLQVEANRREGS